MGCRHRHVVDREWRRRVHGTSEYQRGKLYSRFKLSDRRWLGCERGALNDRTSTATAFASGDMMMTIIHLLLVLIIWGVVLWIIWWAISQIPAPPPVMVAIRVIFALIVALVALEILLPLTEIDGRTLFR